MSQDLKAENDHLAAIIAAVDCIGEAVEQAGRAGIPMVGEHYDAILDHADALATALAAARKDADYAHAWGTSWYEDYREEHAKRVEAEQRAELVRPLVVAAIAMLHAESSTDYPNGDPDVQEARQRFYDARFHLWDEHYDDLDWFYGDLPDAGEATP